MIRIEKMMCYHCGEHIQNVNAIPTNKETGIVQATCPLCGREMKHILPIDNCRIEKVKFCKRGFGTMTAALFRNDLNQWDYVEVVYPSDGEYQRDARGLSDKDAQSLVGQSIKEIRESGYFQIHSSKFHNTEISPEGEITSMWC